ncbi:MAG: metallophosphoesterase [Planctomycetaceae bacterium]|nr:metallophosphoesterase [Planctomycetaceae bacterium]
MKKTGTIGIPLLTLLALALLSQRHQDIQAKQEKPGTVTGVVFHDTNNNGKRDAGESALEGIRVSNGRQIVKTDDAGKFQLPIDEDSIVFVIKPSGWRTPLNENKLPRFYYIHKPAGSPKQRYAGVEPTGPLPDSVDFPLYPQQEPDEFKAIMFGDPQPRDQKEIDYIAHDVVEELIGTDASFGVTLGDIMFDNLSLFQSQARAVALLGIPWYNVIGNHDINTDARSRKTLNETFELEFGPSYYSFDYGKVHFMVLDDIAWKFNEETGKGSYSGGLGPEQMEFIRNDLALIPKDQLIVLMMHIPLVNVSDREELYRLIEQRPFSMSISGHTHHHEHRFITKKDGWRGPKPHHHIINVTVSGSWWSGTPDERGIPHTTMADGAPNGYSIITFDGHEYRMDFKAAGRSADYQMQIHAPEVVAKAESQDADVYVNVFNGSEYSKTELRIVPSGEWQEMERKVMKDPSRVAVFDADNAVKQKPWRGIVAPKACPHLWHAKLPAVKNVGTYLIEIRSTDRHGRVYNGKRTIRVE